MLCRRRACAAGRVRRARGKASKSWWWRTSQVSTRHGQSLRQSSSPQRVSGRRGQARAHALPRGPGAVRQHGIGAERVDDALHEARRSSDERRSRQVHQRCTRCTAFSGRSARTCAAAAPRSARAQVRLEALERRGARESVAESTCSRRAICCGLCRRASASRHATPLWWRAAAASCTATS